MKRLWHTWVVFGLCLAVVLITMGWLSAKVLELDRARAQADRQAVLEENIRLALWRMDSTVTGLIAAENANPYFYYSPFYPPERAYDRMFAQVKQGEILMPSPLLTQAAPFVLLHFQFSPDGSMASPQVPAGNMLDLAEARYTSYDRIKTWADRLGDLRGILTKETLLTRLRDESSAPAKTASPTLMQDGLAPVKFNPEDAASQRMRADNEYNARFSNAGQESVQSRAITRALPRRADVSEHLMKPVWVGPTLLLARRISINKQQYLQGCWLDWPGLRQALLEGVGDLLPGASLEPATAGSGGDPTRMLASLPVRLSHGTVPAYSGGDASPLLFSLIVAWACVIVGASAVAALLSGAVSLSERRAAFVSAVTHELRTPLSTFRMYTEMLSEGMVPDGEKHRQYLKTLHTEAERLAHLVENVLAYARLERGRPGGRSQSISIRELLGRIRDRLSEHAERSGMELEVEAGEEILEASLRADLPAVEQILFNLVDNACKYASAASNRVIRVGFSRSGGRVSVSVRDHGPGVSESDRRRIWSPFSKSAADAAGSAPGVGLGLALSRRLARQMGGGLRLDTGVREGACFVLTFPAS